jgi:hypothetical protein
VLVEVGLEALGDVKENSQLRVPGLLSEPVDHLEEAGMAVVAPPPPRRDGLDNLCSGTPELFRRLDEVFFFQLFLALRQQDAARGLVAVVTHGGPTLPCYPGSRLSRSVLP